LFARLIAQTSGLVAMLAALLFGFSGDLGWPETWIFLALSAAIPLAVGGWLMARDPALLKARMSSPFSNDQTRPVRILIAVIGAGFLAWIAAMGWDHRLHGRELPVVAEAAGGALIGLGIALVCWTFAANSFAAPQVRVQAERGQTVIDTGPYRFVRHPMYAGADLYLVGVAMLLGSRWGLAGAGVLILGIGVRSVGEEAVLREGLAGYGAYSERVRFRIVPGLW
jgi:protein-S-isoprenylcysteine O-methyltransferase Ste14